MKQDALYRATLRFRRGEGWRVRPEMEPYDGKRGVFSVGWHITEEDRKQYAGEAAMLPCSSELPIGWVASGDLVDVEEMSEEETVSHFRERSGR